MDGTLSLVTGPSIEPLTVDEAKDWARITDDTEDAVVERLISAARGHVEELTGRALITQTWDYFLDAFPGTIDVPRPRLISVTHLKYTDEDGTLQTLDVADYTIDLKREPARIVPAYGESWPGTRDVPNAVELRFVAGYGATATSVPEQLRQAIAVLVATMYEQREMATEASTGQQLTDVPIAFWQLVNQHRMWWL
jgi:uncharacterized phiE125 gp8 family phage protein